MRSGAAACACARACTPAMSACAAASMGKRRTRASVSAHISLAEPVRSGFARISCERQGKDHTDAVSSCALACNGLKYKTRTG